MNSVDCYIFVYARLRRFIDFSPHEQFAPWTFRPTFRPVDDSPIDVSHHVHGAERLCELSVGREVLTPLRLLEFYLLKS